jgi:fructose-1-phosphate kinase PfkB-like protein
LKILCICLSPAIQRTLCFKSFNTEEVNRSSRYTLCAGGKAVNSSRVLEQLEKGCSEVLCPAGSENAGYFSKLAEKDGLTLHTVTIQGKTRECWTAVSGGRTTEIIADENYEKDAGAEKELLSALKGLLPAFAAVIFAGSCPSVFSDELPLKICRIIKEQNKLFLTDFKGESLLNVLESAAPSFVKINEKEFFLTFNQRASEKILTRLSKTYGSTIIVTRGKKAVLCADKDSFYKTKPKKIKQPVNTTGCGDSFNAGFLYEYIKSKDIKKALAAGNNTGALNAMTLIPGDISI